MLYLNNLSFASRALNLIWNTPSMSQCFIFAGNVDQVAKQIPSGSKPSPFLLLLESIFILVTATNSCSKQPVFYLAFSTLWVFFFNLPGESIVTPRLFSCLSVALITLSLSTTSLSVSEAMSVVSSISWHLGPSSLMKPDFTAKWSCSSEDFRRWFTWPYRKREQERYHMGKTTMTCSC